MKQIKILLVVLLVLTIGFSGFTYFYKTQVLDTVSPVLTSDREVLELSVEDDPAMLFAGLTAMDNRDGDLTGRIIIDHISNLIDEGTARISYVVFDNSDNFAKLTRTVHYTDYVGPRFSLEKPLVFTVGTNVSLSGRLHAWDALYGDISQDIQVVSQDVNANAPGLYTVTVQVTNALGDTVLMPLKLLTLQSDDLPQIQLKEYLVYTEQGVPFKPKEYIESVRDPGAPSGSQNLSVTAVRSIGLVDTETPGVYTVQFYCNGENGAGYTLLTVVVE